MAENVEKDQHRKSRRSKFPDIVAFMLFVPGMVILLADALNRKNLSYFLDCGMISTAVYFGFTSWRKGALRELLSIFRFVAAVFFAFFAKEIGMKIIGLQGILGILGGFYLFFFVLYYLLGVLFEDLAPSEAIPTLPGKILGAMLGIGKGVLLFCIISVVLDFLPMKFQNTSTTIFQPIGKGAIESVLPNIIPDSASGALAMIALSKDMQNGLDPEKIDHEMVRIKLAPILESPKIQEFIQDPEIARLFEEKNIQSVFRSKKFFNLLSDPEIQNVGSQIDLHGLAQEIKKGIRTPNQQ